MYSAQGSEATKTAALDLINHLEKVDTPPALASSPLCLTADLSSNSQNLFVCIRDLDLQSYMQEVQRHVKGNWRPPEASESRSSTVTFQILTDGTIRDLKISQSSDAKATDQAALDAVKKSVPFNLPPDGYCGALNIQFTLDYRVHYKSR